jgi:hypothetical protein
VAEDVISKEEVRAALEARRELGPEMEPAIVDAFVERIEQSVAARAAESERALKRKRDHQKEMVLGAMGISIPMLCIAAIFTGLAGVIVVCVALAMIALVTAR